MAASDSALSATRACLSSCACATLRITITVSTKTGDRPFYEGLYIADGSIVPTALGVNPSLTISALALRIGDKIIAELAR